uniref:Uncharacterized protein n=1 Tax=Chromera velia CCMP2878 TaxID=1169474 RepID=A0A0G4FH90_9ALVE|eukprot:Cvel_16818.t1-p1 / transcript=Cvel_16818.t1 / gene=Cvel_16818 / organism=Chromera_velia_CCMP2878 / gene_product=hypothetical protein / transcript_product=hypothetical protein / location=Cvel_scaffold1313:28319-29104(-) / protein_length=262 / sequence_SO=supercontig / SO=protein_coding / is_pseudo=false
MRLLFCDVAVLCLSTIVVDCSLLITNSSVYPFVQKSYRSVFVPIDEVETVSLDNFRCTSLQGSSCGLLATVQSVAEEQSTQNNTFVQRRHSSGLPAFGLTSFFSFLRGGVSSLFTKLTKTEQHLVQQISSHFSRWFPPASKEAAYLGIDRNGSSRTAISSFSAVSGRLSFGSLRPGVSSLPLTFSQGLPAKRIATWGGRHETGCWDVVGGAYRTQQTGQWTRFEGATGVRPCNEAARGEYASVAFSGPLVLSRLWARLIGRR